MFKPFKACFLYQLQSPWSCTQAEAQALLEVKRNLGCPKTEPQHRGWVTPYPIEQPSLIHLAGPIALMTLQFEKRLLPATVVNDEAKAKLEALEDEQGFPATGRQKREIRDDIRFRLLPQAFVNKRQVRVMVHTQANWLALDCSSAAIADQCMELIHQTFPEILLSRYALSVEPRQWMTQALLTPGFLPGDELELASDCQMVDRQNTSSKIKFHQHQLQDAPVIEHLQDHEVTELSLRWKERWQLTLHHDGHMSKVKPLEAYETTQMQDLQPDEDPLAHFDASFALFAGEWTDWVATWLTLFGPKETP